MNIVLFSLLSDDCLSKQCIPYYIHQSHQSNLFIKTTLTLMASIIAGIVQNKEYHVPRKKQRNVNTIDNVK